MATSDRPTFTDTTATGGNGQAAAEEAKRKAARGASTAHDTVERVADRAHDTVDKMAGAASRAADNLGERGEQFSEYSDRAIVQARTYMQEHPIATIGIAVATGFLLSKILSSSEH